jgi:hypothetical protein
MGIELFEHGEQHQADHQPNGNFRKPLIVQAKLQKGRGLASVRTAGRPGTDGVILGISTLAQPYGHQKGL